MNKLEEFELRVKSAYWIIRSSLAVKNDNDELVEKCLAELEKIIKRMEEE